MMGGHDHSSGVNHKLSARDRRNYCSFYDSLHLKPVFPQSENIVFVVWLSQVFFHRKSRARCALWKNKSCACESQKEDLKCCVFTSLFLLKQANKPEWLLCVSFLSDLDLLTPTWLIAASSGADATLLLSGFSNTIFGLGAEINYHYTGLM